MATSVGAASWSLTTTRPPGMPSNIANPNKKPVYANIKTTVDMSAYVSKCSKFSSTEDSNGNLAYARTYCQILLNDNKTNFDSTAPKYHRKVASSTSATIMKKFSYGYYAKARFYLIKPTGWAGTANMSGTFNFT